MLVWHFRWTGEPAKTGLSIEDNSNYGTQGQVGHSNYGTQGQVGHSNYGTVAQVCSL